uniref:Uncharacterized protein n=2 Tax=Toxoplasma gondii TaxID=5811 RepID=A0A2G8XMQ4_TOXGO|nr:hypothetical protein TGCOUG_301218 [Toxoplasma gondii COUG]
MQGSERRQQREGAGTSHARFCAYRSTALAGVHAHARRIIRRKRDKETRFLQLPRSSPFSSSLRCLLQTHGERPVPSSREKPRKPGQGKPREPRTIPGEKPRVNGDSDLRCWRNKDAQPKTAGERRREKRKERKSKAKARDERRKEKEQEQRWKTEGRRGCSHLQRRSDDALPCLRVMTYNILHKLDARRAKFFSYSQPANLQSETRLARVRDELRDLQPHVACLQRQRLAFEEEDNRVEKKRHL